MSDSIKVRLRLEELWRARCAERSSLVGRFTGHGIVQASTLGVPDGLSVDQYVTAALIEAYEQGREDTREEARAIATAARQGTLQLFTRRLRGYADDLEREVGRLP